MDSRPVYVNKGVEDEYVNADVAGKHEYMNLMKTTFAHNFDMSTVSDVNDLKKLDLDLNIKQNALNSQYDYAVGVNNSALKYDFVEEMENQGRKIKFRSQKKNENGRSVYPEYLELKLIDGDTDGSASCHSRRGIIWVCIVTSLLAAAGTFVCAFILKGQGTNDLQNTEQTYTATNYHSTSTETTTEETFKTPSAIKTTTVTAKITKATPTTPNKEVKEKNLALHKRALQSSTMFHGSADRAVDGNKNSSWRAGTCTHTRMDFNPWWQVNLGAAFQIESVVLTNRQDCCGQHLNGVAVKAGMNVLDMHICGETTSDFTNVETILIKCRKPVQAQFVRVYVPRRKTELTICEVEVYGTEV